MPNYQCFTVRVPKAESKRFRTIVKALDLDYEVSAMSPLDKSIMEEKAGMVQTYASVEDLIKEIG